MLETLAKGFRNAKQRLAGKTELSEENLEAALGDVRRALLDADVEVSVARAFVSEVRDKALGRVVSTSVRGKDGGRHLAGPAEQFIYLCQRELEALMGPEQAPLTFAAKPQATGIMMVGLQGSGKTTTSAKLAALLEREFGRKVLLVAADVQRPGAIEQLQVLGQQVDVPVFAIPGGQPPRICEQAMNQARRLKRDTIIYDTAGRLTIDDALMSEVADIRRCVNPQNTLLVIDAMIGQDSVRTAGEFHKRLGLTGVVLTKLDGDARGGAALSIRKSTGTPIAFVGTGESMDRLEPFRAEGLASRILGFGDVISLMKDFEGVVDEQQAEVDAQRMLAGSFTFDDFLRQIEMLQQMGSVQDLLEKVPFFAESMPDGFRFDERDLVRTKAMVSSMTPAERRDYRLFQRQSSRLKRVARGSGRSERDVADLIQRFAMMQQLMGSIGMQAGALGKIPGMKQLAMSRQLGRAVRTGGLEHNPMLANLADSLLEAAVAEQGGGNSTPLLSIADKRRLSAASTKRRSLRKQQRKARQKSRRR